MAALEWEYVLLRTVVCPYNMPFGRVFYGCIIPAAEMKIKLSVSGVVVGGWRCATTSWSIHPLTGVMMFRYSAEKLEAYCSVFALFAWRAGIVIIYY